jgi:Prophage CP4-57 regulatory protein (AlpA)
MTVILRFLGLKARGVCGSRAGLHRLRKDTDFPKPVLIGGGIGWIESEIDAWLESRPRVFIRAQESTIVRNRAALAACAASAERGAEGLDKFKKSRRLIAPGVSLPRSDLGARE